MSPPNPGPARPRAAGHWKAKDPMSELKNDQLLTIVTQIAEKHGCKIVDIDLENHTLNLDGPECNQVACAIELESVLG
jgi:hypothetical protein